MMSTSKTTITSKTSFRLEPVVDKQSIAAYHEVPHIIYKGIEAWVPLLEEEVEGIFNPEKNKMFQGGASKRWVLRDKSGELVGRIAAFYNTEKANFYEIPVGGIGFFDCIDNQEAAFCMFDAAKEWLHSKGMKAMDGPINFGENDRFWGLLTEGFTHASYGMNFNPPWYEKFFDNYGFEVYFEQISKHLDITKELPARFKKIFEWVKNKDGVRFDYARKKEVEKYGADFMDIYNDAWKFHEHFTLMNMPEVKRLVNELKMVMIERFMIFAYVHDEPAGFLFCLPDLNQIFKSFRGKFPLWQKLLFVWRKRNDYAWYRKKGILTRGRVMIIGVKPKFQKYGFEAGLTMFSMEDAKKMGFKEIELSWVGDFNPMSRRLQDATDAKLGKIHKTYRIAFDPEYKWKRAHKLEAETRGKEEAS